MSQVGFHPPPVDDTSYEADTLPTKPPRLDFKCPLFSVKIFSIVFDVQHRTVQSHTVKMVVTLMFLKLKLLLLVFQEKYLTGNPRCR